MAKKSTAKRERLQDADEHAVREVDESGAVQGGGRRRPVAERNDGQIRLRRPGRPTKEALSCPATVRSLVSRPATVCPCG
jgi:hypothetical protein